MSDQIVYPPAIVEPANPIGVLIYLHGQGGNGTVVSESFQREAALQPFKGVFPHASLKSSQFGHEATSWIHPFGLGDVHQLVQDARKVRLQAEFIHELIDEEIRKGTASSKIFVGGTRSGGALALYAGLTYPKPLAGLFVVSSWVPIKHVLRNRHAANINTPITHVRATADPPIIPAELQLNLAEIIHQDAIIASEDRITAELAEFMRSHVGEGAPVTARRIRQCQML